MAKENIDGKMAKVDSLRMRFFRIFRGMEAWINGRKRNFEMDRWQGKYHDFYYKCYNFSRLDIVHKHPKFTKYILFLYCDF